MLDECMSQELLHEYWRGSSEADAPHWVLNTQWNSDDAVDWVFFRAVEFNIVSHSAGLRMARESSQIWGIPNGRWMHLSYDVLVSNK